MYPRHAWRWIHAYYGLPLALVLCALGVMWLFGKVPRGWLGVCMQMSPVVATGCGAIAFRVRQRRLLSRVRAADRCLCTECGYPLAGLEPLGLCPECGRGYGHAALRETWRRWEAQVFPARGERANEPKPP